MITESTIITTQTSESTSTTPVNPFANPKIVSARIGQQFSLNCSLASEQDNIAWVMTYLKEGTYNIGSDNGFELLNNGRTVSFNSISITDEEIFLCGIVNPNGTFTPLNALQIYVIGNF